jgi:hypothetical protein
MRNVKARFKQPKIKKLKTDDVVLCKVVDKKQSSKFEY